MQTDSSLSGYAVSVAQWPQAVVQACGRVPERSRFYRAGGHQARESALEQAGFERGPDGKWAVSAPSSGTGAPADAAGWAVDEHVHEVPAPGLASELWHTVLVQPWRRPEGSLTLEARALVAAIRRAAVAPRGKFVR